MSKSKRKGKPSADKPRPARASIEPRSVELLTHAWMLTTFATMLLLLLAAATRGYLAWIDPAAVKLGLLSGLALFAALVLGVLGLLLEAAVLRWRSEPAPRPVVAAASVILLTPIVIAVALRLR